MGRAAAPASRPSGQIEDAAIGVYFYKARFYDPALGRFIQADTLVPSPENPQSLNRYSYVLNSPLRYTDPSGHYTSDEIQKYLQETYGSDWQAYWDAWQADPYWMWILDQAQDNFVLKIAATSGPHPASWVLQNPNGIGYPAPRRN